MSGLYLIPFAGVCGPEGGHQQAEPHHPQQAEGPACLRAGLLRPDPTQQVGRPHKVQHVEFSWVQKLPHRSMWFLPGLLSIQCNAEHSGPSGSHCVVWRVAHSVLMHTQQNTYTDAVFVCVHDLQTSMHSVEKPFLKPVILSGPHTGERRRLLEMLVEEFPDVFALPRQHTTRPPDLHSKHVGVDGDELQLVSEQKGSRPHSAAAGVQGSPADAAGAPAAGDHPSSSAEVTADGSLTAGGSVSAGSSSADGGGDECSSTSKTAVELLPPPRVLSKEEFEAAVSSGQLLEHHADLFTHPLAVHRHGYSMADLQGIIKADKLPLLELEAEQTELVKVTKSVDCLSIFLAPPSLEEHEQRLQLAATESNEEVAARGEVAAAELAAARAQGVFDEVLVNDDFEEGYAQLKAAISRFRPDLIPPAATDAAARAAQQSAAASTAVPLLVAGPAGGRLERADCG